MCWRAISGRVGISLATVSAMPSARSMMMEGRHLGQLFGGPPFSSNGFPVGALGDGSRRAGNRYTPAVCHMLALAGRVGSTIDNACADARQRHHRRVNVGRRRGQRLVGGVERQRRQTAERALISTMHEMSGRTSAGIGRDRPPPKIVTDDGFHRSMPGEPAPIVSRNGLGETESS